MSENTPYAPEKDVCFAAVGFSALYICHTDRLVDGVALVICILTDFSTYSFYHFLREEC